MTSPLARNISRALALLATTAVLVPAPSALAQTAPDTEAPRLVSFNFTPKTVDAASGETRVVVTARWTDDSGLRGTAPELVSFRSTTTSQSTAAFLDRVSGTPQDATYQGTATVPQGAAPGTWAATLFGPDDVLGNTVGFESLLNFPQALTVVNGNTSPPTTPPTTPPTPPVEQPAQPTQIATQRQTIDFGGTVDLGVLGEAGQVVDLYAASARTPFRVIRTTTLSTGGTGSAGWLLQPGETTTFYAQVRGGDRSQQITVNVRRTVTIGIRQASGIYTFSGQISRAAAGVQVTVARLDAVTKRVTGVASTRTTADGRYEIRTSLPVGQAGYYALTSAKPDLQAGRSRLYGLVVNARPAATPPNVTARDEISLNVQRGNGFYLFSGQVSPGRSVLVTLTRSVGGRLVSVAGTRSASNGLYSVRVPLGPGTYAFQAITATVKSRLYGLNVPVPVAPVVRPPVVPSQPAVTFYANCDAVRAAGRAPLFRGQPGYRPALDREGDGIACE